MKVLQVNLERSKVAHNLAFLLSEEKEAEIIVVAEPKENWLAAAGGCQTADRTQE